MIINFIQFSDVCAKHLGDETTIYCKNEIYFFIWSFPKGLLAFLPERIRGIKSRGPEGNDEMK